MTRILQWEGCLNVRDLGGVPLAHGRETRFGALVRADNVGNLTDEGWRALAGHGIARIVDLRWQDELESDPPRDVDIDLVHVELLGPRDPDYADDIADYMAASDPAGYWSSFYLRVLEDHRANFGAAFAAIADAEGCVLFHCAGGKDRTGMLAALILRLAGAEIDDVAQDYSLSADLLHAGGSRWIDEAPDEADRAQRRFMQQTPPEAMARTLRELEARYGDVAGYLRAAGLDDVRIERLKERLAAT